MRGDPLAERVRISPERLAAVDAETGERWTYADLDRAVAPIAGGLDGIRPGDRIGVMLPTSMDAVMAIHAGLRVGASIVPINPALGPDTLARQLSHAAPAVVLATTTTDVPAVDGIDARVTTPEGLAAGEERRTDTVERAWDDEVLLLFTSGTTGEPKPVPLTSANLVASAAGSAFRLGVLPTDNWLCCLPVNHMGGVAPILRSGLYGTAVTIHEGFDAGAVGETIADGGISGISLVPTQLRRLLEAGVTLSGLRFVLLGGAPAPAGLIDRCVADGVPVYPTYGLTETASQVTTATPTEAVDHTGTVGRPLLGTTVTIVDDTGEAVPEGTRGEIVVDGPTVTPGYADGRELPMGRYGFHTGDIGYLDGGRLWVTGRVSDVIITGGEQVYPREVEAALRDQPAVEAAAVVGLDDPEWGERVAALIVGDGPDPADLETQLGERLAPYKIPKTWGFAETLPRTTSGTVDRAAVRRRLRGVNNPDGR